MRILSDLAVSQCEIMGELSAALERQPEKEAGGMDRIIARHSAKLIIHAEKRTKELSRMMALTQEIVQITQRIVSASRPPD